MTGGVTMRKKGYKGRCKKKDLSKCKEICRTYDVIQSNYADILQNDNDIQEIRCNVAIPRSVIFPSSENNSCSLIRFVRKSASEVSV